MIISVFVILENEQVACYYYLRVVNLSILPRFNFSLQGDVSRPEGEGVSGE